MTREEIAQKAHKIIQEEKQRKEHIFLCVKAKICPNDGSPLVITTKREDNIYTCSCGSRYIDY